MGPYKGDLGIWGLLPKEVCAVTFDGKIQQTQNYGKMKVTQALRSIDEKRRRSHEEECTPSDKAKELRSQVRRAVMNSYCRKRPWKRAERDLRKLRTEDMQKRAVDVNEGTPLSGNLPKVCSTSLPSYAPTIQSQVTDFKNIVDPDCPSLTRNRTTSSRTSPTKSAQSPSISVDPQGREKSTNSLRRCPVAECSTLVKDIDAHMFTHGCQHPKKCPIGRCEYYSTGVAQASDMVQHIHTHFKGIMFCGFCPNELEKAFNQYDVLSQHLIVVHGAKETYARNPDGHRSQHGNLIPVLSKPPPTQFSSKPHRQCATDVKLRLSCLTKEQRDILEAHLLLQRYPSTTKRNFAETSNVTVDKVNNWFQNRRAKAKQDAKTQQNQNDMRDNRALHRPRVETSIAECVLCSESFDPQRFLDHLTGCVYREVLETEAHHLESRSETRLPVISSGPGSSGPPLIAIKCESFTGSAGLSNGVIITELSLADGVESDGADMADITAPSPSMSPTSSFSIDSSDEEMGGTEETSSDESEPDTTTKVLAPLKRQLVNSIMQEFHRSLQSNAASNGGMRTCNGGGSSGNSSYHSNGGGGSSSQNSSSQSRKRGMSARGSPPRDGDGRNGDDPNKRQRPNSNPSGNEAYLPARRFACPYYKRNPGRHQTFTSCRDPGFNTVARLKEHLYRRHLLPIQCHRCCSIFPNESALREHQRNLQGCTVQEYTPSEGFDKGQERQLKSKKRYSEQQTEEDKWGRVYRILFPDDNEDDMPEPYIEYQAPGNRDEHSTNVKRFQEFSRRELPRLVRQRLEVVVEREAQPLEGKLKERLVDIVKECQSQLDSLFRCSIASEASPSFEPAIPGKAPRVPSDAPPDVSSQSARSQNSVSQDTIDASAATLPTPPYVADWQTNTSIDCSQSIDSVLSGNYSQSSVPNRNLTTEPQTTYDGTWTEPRYVLEDTLFGTNEFSNKGNEDCFYWNWADEEVTARVTE